MPKLSLCPASSLLTSLMITGLWLLLVTDTRPACLLHLAAAGWCPSLTKMVTVQLAPSSPFASKDLLLPGITSPKIKWPCHHGGHITVLSQLKKWGTGIEKKKKREREGEKQGDRHRETELISYWSFPVLAMLVKFPIRCISKTFSVILLKPFLSKVKESWKRKLFDTGKTSVYIRIFIYILVSL